MRVLTACDRSGIMRDAFIAQGHDAISCDLFPSRRSGPHYHGPVQDILGKSWDLLIAMPVCKYMANSGVRWLTTEEGRWEKLEEGAAFYNIFKNATHIKKRAIENPIIHKYANALIGRPKRQFVQPWMFGDPFAKATGLELIGLPDLVPEFTKAEMIAKHGAIVQKCWRMAPSPDREEKRSETEPGLARAMAKQWS